VSAVPTGRPALGFVLVAVLTDMPAIGLIIAVLPAPVGQLTGGQAEQAIGRVAHRPPGDVWRGLPFFLCALLQAPAALLAIRHLRRQRGAPAAAPLAP
jgi:hypothetical protein